jgi:hypothetical protein
VGSLFYVQAAEQTAHPKCGPRRRPGITSDRCTQIGEQPDFHELTARTGLPFNWIVNALQSRLLQRKRSANTVPRYKSWPRF